MLTENDAQVTQLLMRLPSLVGSMVPDDLPAGYELREAKAGDTAALAHLLTVVFADAWTSARVQAELLDDPQVVLTLVVTQLREVVGTASVCSFPQRYPQAGYLHYVGIAPAHRGHHLGVALLQHTVWFMVHQGWQAAVLETDDWREAALRLYLRFGFVPVYRTEMDQQRWSAIFRALLR